MDTINNLIYFNNNGTTAIDKGVAETMLQYAGDDFKDLDKLKAEAQVKIAKLIGCKPAEIFFTAGTTKSIHIGIEVMYQAYSSTGNHIITNKTEHDEVLKACEHLKAKGAEVTYLDVDPEGLVDPEALRWAIKPATILVSIMAANNQTGVIQPVEKISEICKENNISFFSDASQFVGKMRCDMNELGIDCMAFGSHKMHGPRGIGALYAKDGTAEHKILLENEAKNAAAVNSAMLLGFAGAAEVFMNNYWEDSAHISKLKNYFEHQLLDLEGLRINGSTRYRIYNTSTLTFPPSKKISLLADRFKFVGFEKGSHVLKAMGLQDEDIKNSYRFSFGKYNTLDEVKFLVEEINRL